MIYQHWQYFITLDSDLDNTSRYVEIGPENYKTFSIQFVQILLASCSEIDVVAKILCKNLDPLQKPENMDEYRSIITKTCPNFNTMIITVPHYGLQLIPWEDWKQDKNPLWWKIYNKVKHERDSFFKEANLENTINAVAGLFVLVVYLYAYKKTLYIDQVPSPKLLSVDEKYTGGCGFKNTYEYITPDEI